MLRGGEELLPALSQRLGDGRGRRRRMGKVTLEFAECLGACEGAPCMLVNDECLWDLTEEIGDCKAD